MTPLRQICFQALTMLLPVEVSTRALKEPGRIEDISRYVGYSKYLKRTAWIHVYLCHSGLEKGSGCLAVEAYGAHALQGVSIQVFGVHRISKAPTASQMNHQEVWSHWQTGLRWFQSKFCDFTHMRHANWSTSLLRLCSLSFLFVFIPCCIAIL